MKSKKMIEKLLALMLLMILLLSYFQSFVSAQGLLEATDAAPIELVNVPDVLDAEVSYELGEGEILWTLAFDKVPANFRRALVMGIEITTPTGQGTFEQIRGPDEAPILIAVETGELLLSDYAETGIKKLRFKTPFDPAVAGMLTVLFRFRVIEEQVTMTAAPEEVTDAAAIAEEVSEDTNDAAPVTDEMTATLTAPTETIELVELLNQECELQIEIPTPELPEPTETQPIETTETTELTEAGDKTEPADQAKTLSKAAPAAIQAAAAPQVAPTATGQLFPTAISDAVSLIIAPDAFSTLTVSSRAQANGQANIYSKNGSQRGTITSVEHAQTRVYSMFAPGSTSQALVYGNLAAQINANPNGSTLTDGAGNSEVITIDYSNVGFVNIGTSAAPILKPIAARVTLENIIIGASTANHQSGECHPIIEISNNLYSGMFYEFVKKMDITFEFYDPETSEAISFAAGATAADGALLTFASLNAYPDRTTYPSTTQRQRHEFAGSLSGATGILSTGTLLSGPRGNEGYDSGTYWADKAVEGADFVDQLGSVNFNTAAVSFPITGTLHKFKFGSTWGRAWNTFASSAPIPTLHTPPTKTVQHLNSVVDGAASGFGHRYHNDLDRYNDGGGTWDLPATYRVAGHDADDPATLAANVEEKADRFVETGEEHYYYINQKTINLVSEGLVQPTGYQIEDTLPAGVTLSDSTWRNSIVLYDLNGVAIANPFTNDSSYDPVTNKLVLKLSAAAVNTINTQSTTNYGGDFSIQIKVKVTNTTTDAISDLMENQAQTTFLYNNNVSYDQLSNKVHTRVKIPTLSLPVRKIWADNGNRWGLREAITIQLQSSTDNVNWGDVSGKSVTLPAAAADADLSHIFTDLPLYTIVSGLKTTLYYRIVETPALAAYGPPIYAPLSIKADAVTTQTELTVTNPLLLTPITFTKVLADGTPLAGAEFTLYQSDDTLIEGPVASQIDGTVTFATQVPIGTYIIKETKTPVGLKTITPINLTVAKDAGGNLTVTGFTDGKVANVPKDYDLTLTKVDKETNQPLSEVTFTISGPAFAAPTAFTTNTAGVITINDLTPGTYSIEETVGKDEYFKITTSFEFTIHADGSVTPSAANDPDAWTDFSYELLAEGNNLIRLTAKNTPKTFLPVTGGPGSAQYLRNGLLALIGASLFGLYLVKRTRKAKEAIVYEDPE